MIEAAAKMAGSGKAVVLGCGKCSEIPLQYLGKVFDEIDLVDLDLYSLSSVERMCQLWPETEALIHFYHADLTGLIRQIEPNARAIVEVSNEPLPCLEKLGQLLITVEPHFWLPSGGEQYHLIVCSAILTQLEIAVRQAVVDCFLERYPAHAQAVSFYEPWRRQAWDFARSLESAFIDHLRLLLAPGGIVYLSETVHVCWLFRPDSQTFASEGSWVATRTSRLADYLSPQDELLLESHWNWLMHQPEGPYWGRLYRVQAVAYRPTHRQMELAGERDRP